MMLFRLNLRVVLAALCICVLIVILLWSQCGSLTPIHRPGSVLSNPPVEKIPLFAEDIQCLINGEYSVTCKRVRDEVYVPFDFIHKYFEIYGKVTNLDGIDRFDWSHSYGKVYHPKKKYDPRGTFTTFENYNVEVRERVKCISGIDGVPVTTQWDPKGYYYPTQIAQFGLSHYSKNLTEKEPRRLTLDDGQDHTLNWILTDGAEISREFDNELNSIILKFMTKRTPSSLATAKLNITLDLVLSVDVNFKPNSSLTAVLEHKRDTVYLHYVSSNDMITAQGNHIYYGIGTEENWKHITRDLIVDMQKGWVLLDKPKRKSPRTKFKLSGLSLNGEGSVNKMRVASSEHMAAVYAASDWLVRSQRPGGGWPAPVKRRVLPGLAELQPGWYSAMSQGHALSLLSRAYYRSGQEQYLTAATRALHILSVARDNGGVQAMFMGKYVWYEEYPTKPPLFVLNGFIYTLLGLYDLHVIQGEPNSPAKKLFDDGMTSLKALLPLFDTGSGSFYDLRHMTLGVSPNIARWDYHATHVNQLYLLTGLDDDPILLNTAKRWEGYMQGKRAAHN